MNFINDITDFIFVENQPEKADVIFVPGSSFPENAEKAAAIWKAGYAPYVLPSGKYSIVNGKFSGVEVHAEKYNGNYESEWDFLRDVLVKNGVEETAILREDQAEYTYQNALLSKAVLKNEGIEVNKAILCPKTFHARRSLMYYEYVFPNVEFFVCPAEAMGINRENWMRSNEGIQMVFGELKRCGEQFGGMLVK